MGQEGADEMRIHMEKEKGEGEKREKHMKWFLLLFIGVAHFIFNKKGLSFMSKYSSKSVQVLIVAAMPSSKSLLSPSGF